MKSPTAAIVCDAIRRRALLEFEYNGRVRVVAPYCHGISTRGTEVLRALEMQDGKAGIGKLWALDQMVNARVLAVNFLPNDPNYNPMDSAMKSICCRV